MAKSVLEVFADPLAEEMLLSRIDELVNGARGQASPEQTIAPHLGELSLPDLLQDSQAVAKSAVEVFADPLAEDIGAWSMRLGEVPEVFRVTDHVYGKPAAPATSATGSTPRPRPAWPRARPAGRSRTTCS